MLKSSINRRGDDNVRRPQGEPVRAAGKQNTITRASAASSSDKSAVTGRGRGHLIWASHFPICKHHLETILCCQLRIYWFLQLLEAKTLSSVQTSQSHFIAEKWETTKLLYVLWKSSIDQNFSVLSCLDLLFTNIYLAEYLFYSNKTHRFVGIVSMDKRAGEHCVREVPFKLNVVCLNVLSLNIIDLKN